MPRRWESCLVIRLLEGRGPVRCWLPPIPGHTLCEAHLPGPDATPADTEPRAFISALLHEIHAGAELCELVRLPDGPHYELRAGLPGLVAKWVVVPEGMVRLASVDLAAHRALRNLLATIVLIQQAQLSLDQSRELLAGTAGDHGRSSRRFLPAIDAGALSRDLEVGTARPWILVADDDDAVRGLWSEML